MHTTTHARASTYRGVVGHVDLSTAPGTVYDLTHGKTHCVEYGPEDGPLVVLVHGFGGDHGSLSAYGREFAAKGYAFIRAYAHA